MTSQALISKIHCSLFANQKRDFDCLKGNVCSPFKNYFTHDFNKRNSGTTIAMPKVKLEFTRKSFYFLSASAFIALPLKIKQTSSRALLRESLINFL